MIAIEPDGKPITKPDGKTITKPPHTWTTTAQSADEVRSFVRAHNGEHNLYYSVNPTRKEMVKKAAKTDIAATEYALADLDPAKGETSDAAK